MTGIDSADFIVAIPSSPVQDEFRYLVDNLVIKFTSEFGNELDGIYLYGSLARGDGRPKDSDLDVTLENFRWHDLRHTWASWHVQNGTPLYVLQELGGWESSEMVRRYAHLSTSHLAVYADKLDSLMRV